MTRRNDKRNQRRNRKEDNASSIAASVLFGAIMHKLFGDTLGEKKEETKMKDIVDKPFHGVRKVADNHLECGVILPTDGTAVEIPTPEGFQVFISEDGKPMIRKKAEAKTSHECFGEDDDDEYEEPSTYDEIAEEMYFNKPMFFSTGMDTKSITCRSRELARQPDNCTSEAQVKRLIAYGKLLNIAKYLNKGWTPDYRGEAPKWYIIKNTDNGFSVGSCIHYQYGIIEFHTMADASKAIELMGEESLNDLFNTNY